MVAGVKWIVRGAVVAATGAPLAACALVSGLDNYESSVACAGDCHDDGSARGDEGAPAEDRTLADDAGDATVADGPLPLDVVEGDSDGPALDDVDAPEPVDAEDGGGPDAPNDDAEGGCPTGFLLCDGTCTPVSDPDNCGRCANVCGAEGGAATCQPLPDTNAYVCIPSCPAGNLTLCDAGCVDTTSDPSHCGGCGVACPDAIPHSHPTCGDGGCGYACDNGYSACDGGCVSYTTASNCGSCGAACDTEGGTPLCAPSSVDGGPYACSSGCPASTPSRCGGGCTNTATDLTNCGGCGTSCTTSVSHATPVCSGGSCTFVCDTGYTMCGGACVDVTSDPNNCGGCGVGHVCGLTQTCVSGACTSRCSTTTDCPSGYACNGTTCTTSCSANQACHGGCCQNGSCVSGLSGSACGTGGGACVPCSSQANNFACVNGACGCNVATDCASLNACSTALHQCQGLCGGANTGCNGGCCSNLDAGGTCQPGNVDNQCGGTGVQCSDCQSGCGPGPHCVANACACGSNLDCLSTVSCVGRGICGDGGACEP